MPDPKLTLIFAAKDLASREAAKLKGALNGVHTAALKAGGGIKSAIGSIASLAKTAVLGAAVIGIGLVAALGGAVKAAAAEQVGLIRLNQALKNNVAGFDGNTTAIEKTIAAREKLGFADDEQRQALANLLPLTHSVAKAQALIGIAMDVSRQKSIPLAAAVQIVTKAQLGNVGALKKLGIVVAPVTAAMDKLRASHQKATPAQIKAAKAADTAATATKALAMIQKASVGQADKYGNSIDGMGDAIKITFGDIVEDLGAIFLPVMKTVFGFIRDTAIPALSGVVKGISDWVKNNQPLIDQVGKGLSNGISKVGDVIRLIVPRVMAFAGALFGPGGVAQSIGKVVGPIAADLLPKLGTLFGKIGDITGAIVKLVGALWGDGKGPLAIALKAVGGLFGTFFDILSGPVAGVIENFLKGMNFIIGKVNELLGLGNKKVNEKITNTKAGTGGTGGNNSQVGYGANATGGLMLPGGVYSVGERPGRMEDVVVGPGGAMVYSGSSGKGNGGSGDGVFVRGISEREILDMVDRGFYFRFARSSPSRTRK